MLFNFQQVYHPNIDWEGKVCLNILRQEWMPVLSLGSVVFGLMTLFLVRFHMP
jgi:ubiquitin-conjugating enzyme E2 M